MTNLTKLRIIGALFLFGPMVWFLYEFTSEFGLGMLLSIIWGAVKTLLAAMVMVFGAACLFHSPKVGPVADPEMEKLKERLAEVDRLRNGSTGVRSHNA